MFSVGIPIVCFPITDVNQMLNNCILFYYLSTSLNYFQLFYHSRLPLKLHILSHYNACLNIVGNRN